MEGCRVGEKEGEVGGEGMRLVCVRCSGCVEVGVWNFFGERESGMGR